MRMTTVEAHGRGEPRTAWGRAMIVGAHPLTKRVAAMGEPRRQRGRLAQSSEAGLAEEQDEDDDNPGAALAQLSEVDQPESDMKMTTVGARGRGEMSPSWGRAMIIGAHPVAERGGGDGSLKATQAAEAAGPVQQGEPGRGTR